MVCSMNFLVELLGGEKLQDRNEEDLLTNLTLQGIVAIEDPVRDQVKCFS